MLNLNETKKILKDLEMSDKEAEEIRDGFLNLAEIIYEKWVLDTRELPTDES